MLLLQCAAGALLVLPGGCTSLSQVRDPGVIGTQWTVTELDGKPIAAEVTPTLAIANDGGVSGSDGCNRFVGGLVFQPSGTITSSASAGISTRMACHGASDSVSRRYNALRSEAARWHLDGATLVVSTAEGRTFRLRRSD
jgi:heat shock protein HslJ